MVSVKERQGVKCEAGGRKLAGRDRGKERE